ncbi:unnamed protein product [Pieris macdunnoughi]|uniref:DDE Tnp4 domain-containing protein n=1 Tax=Pieris macdunnoughi TaxID=345717 RepID=A0A821XJS9_9NEOP|nr:unnamed protein product [Pieris macdunnoughi]
MNVYIGLRLDLIVSIAESSNVKMGTEMMNVENLFETDLDVPATEDEWLDTVRLYEQKWQFDHCLGAIDGKHIIIEKPAHSGSLYYNYKGSFNIVLLAIVNANYEFLYVHAGIIMMSNNTPSDQEIGDKTISPSVFVVNGSAQKLGDKFGKYLLITLMAKVVLIFKKG